MFTVEGDRNMEAKLNHLDKVLSILFKDSNDEKDKDPVNDESFDYSSASSMDISQESTSKKLMLLNTDLSEDLAFDNDNNP